MPSVATKGMMFLVLLVGPLACSNKPGTLGKPGPVPPDKSLTIEAYIDNGVPAVDREWNGQELSNAAKVLARIANESGAKLPRYDSNLSGDLFARLTDKSNLNVYKSTWSPPSLRLQDSLVGLQATSELLKLYLAAHNSKEVGAAELVELLGASMRYSQAVVELATDFIPTLDKSAPDYAVRMNGLAQMKSGLATQVSGCLLSLTERHVYRPAELKRLIVHLQSTLPNVMSFLSEQSQSEFVNRLREYDKDPSMDDLDPDLHDLFLAVEEKR